MFANFIPAYCRLQVQMAVRLFHTVYLTIYGNYYSWITLISFCPVAASFMHGNPGGAISRLAWSA